jgi:DNA polymerase-4
MIDILDGHIWRLAEKLADRAKAKGLAGRTVTLKLKRNDFRHADPPHDPARRHADRRPHLPHRPRALRPDGAPEPYRLIGVGLVDLMPAEADREGDLLDPGRSRAAPPRTPPTGSAPASARTRSSRAVR